MVALAVILGFNAAALAAPDAGLALAARLLIGIGTGVGFIAGSAYVRSASGSPFAQGLYGGVALAGGGLALAIVPSVESWIGWRAPFATAVAMALGGIALLFAGPSDRPRPQRSREAHLPGGVLRDARLYRLGLLFASSLGLSVVLGNWVVTLLQREGGAGSHAAGTIGALTLVLGIVSRPIGGWILHAHPSRMRVTVATSLVAGSAGTLVVAAARPPALVVMGAILIGLAAGIPFAPAFTGAALLRPDAQAAAVGVVNGAACLVILVGTPLLGLAFSLPGGGRLGFAVVACLWLVALLVLPSAHELAAEVRPASGSPRG
jgi:predicted MFS family arabinose efflux permease